MKHFGGPVLFLDRDDINTDEIIPARYLTEVKKEALKPYLLEDLTLPGFDPKGPVLQAARVVITRGNFGCGSSREHAPWALEVNDITAVIATSYARIFRQNMFNGGMLAIELPPAEIDALFALAGAPSVDCTIDLDGRRITCTTADGRSHSCAFTLSDFDAALVAAGGWVEFADARY